MIWLGSNNNISSTVINLLNYCSESFPQIQYTLMNYYLPLNNVPVALVLAPEAQRPTAANAITFTSRTFNVTRGQNLTVTEPSVFLPHTLLTPGQTYRMWIWIDRNGTISETDEGDNRIPMGITFRRGAGC